jgi:hypothetical protein
MFWEIKAAEDLKTGDFVEFVTDHHGKLSCKEGFKTGVDYRNGGERYRSGRNAYV